MFSSKPLLSLFLRLSYNTISGICLFYAILCFNATYNTTGHTHIIIFKCIVLNTRTAPQNCSNDHHNCCTLDYTIDFVIFSKRLTLRFELLSIKGVIETYQRRMI